MYCNNEYTQQDACSLSCFDEEVEIETQHLQHYEEPSNYVEYDKDSQELVVIHTRAQTRQEPALVHVGGRSRLQRMWNRTKKAFVCCYKCSRE